MTEDEQGRQRKRGRLWMALAVLVALLAVLIVPPLLSVSRYKSRITSLMAASLGRPVRLSSVSLRLLPRPGFVLYDLTVDEDPGFGAEPLLHASSVTASIRLLSLWRGRLEISEVSVDDASLNLVRSPQGSWNLEPLFRTAATKAGSSNPNQRPAPPFPYIAATNSRVNFKNGVEKLPFSIVDTDLSFWQESPNVWRIRLRGQPARTDVNMELADTGVVELNASAQRAPDLRQMPVHLDLDWRDAQLGQLTRLATGSDAGWRGDLRGEVHLDGTADSAKVTTRLRAKRRASRRVCPGHCRWISTPIADLSTTTPRAPLKAWSATHPLATDTSGWPGICRARARRRASRWNWIAFRWLRVWMPCAPCAAALVPILKPRARPAAR